MSEAALASLSSLWRAMSPRLPDPAPPPPDVGAIAAAAERQGFARGEAEAAARLAPERAVFDRAIAALEAAAAIDPAVLQPLFVELVTRTARAVVDAELRLSPEIVQALVAEALAAAGTDGAATVFLSPDDAAHLSAAFADPDLAPGEVRVETPTHVVAAGLDARLAAVVAGFA